MAAFSFTISSPTNPWTITHNLGDSHPFWIIFDDAGEYIFPTSAVATSADVFTFTFDTALTGGGRILSVLDLVSSASAASFTDLATVKSALGIDADDDSQDESLSRLIAGVSEAMKNYMRRLIVETTHSAEKYHGNGKDSLVLKQYPVVSGAVTVRVDDSAFDPDDFAVDAAAGVIECMPGVVFPRGVANVEVDYVSGYAAGVPQDLNLACVKQVLYERRLQGGRDQISLSSSTIIGAVSESYRLEEWAQGVSPTMDRYRRRA